MKNISNYLSKFFKKVDGDEEYSRKIIEILKDKLNVKAELNDIEIKNGVLYTNFSPAVKNKIFICKEEILFEINSLSAQKIVDIR